MRSKNQLIIIIFLIIGSLVGYSFLYKEQAQIVQKNFEVVRLKRFLNAKIQESNLYENQYFDDDGEKFKIVYSVDPLLDEFIKKRLRYYRPDMAAIVVLENQTGRILSAVGYDRSQKSFNDYLPYSGTHPSASIFKIVTTADLFEDKKIAPDSEFQYRGKGTTLYKYQLKDQKNNRWVRKTSFEKAFALSNNVVFGKAAIENTTPVEIQEMAERLGFNEDLMSELSMSKSTFITPESGYNLAEIASGFNRTTQMSPVHCALLSSVVANNGQLIYPRLVTQLIDQENKIAWDNQLRAKQVISPEVSGELQTVMRATIDRGTARRKFRGLNNRKGDLLDMGGKTGSITGGFPHGKRDWFTSFAVPYDKPQDGISLCVMNINYKKWYVKSSKLAQEIIQYYYNTIKKLE